MKTWSISLRIACISTLFLIVAVFSAGLFGYIHYSKMLTRYNQQIGQGIALAVASHIQPDEYRRIVETKEKTPYWQQLKEQFDRVKIQTDVKYLYALDNNVDGKICFIVEGQLPDEDQALICQLGDVLEEGSYTPRLFEALETGQATVGEVHDVMSFGAMVSGYAPILDENRQVIGIVGADVDVELIQHSLNHFALLSALFTVGVAAFFGFLLFIYNWHTVNKPIDEIIQAAGRLLQDDFFDQELLTTNKATTAEIKKLIKSFKQIREKVIKSDALTGAYSRAAGLKTLELIMEEGANTEGKNCAAFVDVNGLKMINDIHGHLAGDFAIKTIAETLREGVRSSDIVCRYGGDEFLVLFRRCDHKAAEAAINRMKVRLQNINQVQKQPYTIDFSYGLAEIRAGFDRSVKDFIQKLDILMYENKQTTKEL
ncbi:diguanylate cyclase [Deltaproteobacteria bacterium OttesenSCG-928-K17]|nr:diguanylate cyclase [Deltaproteobacteria bacterium OttesenSCG-928-K17]